MDLRSKPRLKKSHRLIGFLLFASVSCGALADAYPKLRDCHDAKLQSGLEASIEKLNLSEAVKRKHLSISLVDITDPYQPRLAAVNGDQMRYAASLPKIAILLGAFVQIEQGILQLDKNTQKTLTDMIRVSSNSAATQMLRRVGQENLADILQSSRFKLYDPAYNGGLWVGKEYASSKAWRRDPLHNISHGATAIQAARFFYLLDTGRLVSPALSAEMKEMLSRPGLNHKFVKGLMSARPNSKIMRKSGSWRRWHADSALVERDGHKYIIVALAESEGAGSWFPQIARELDALIIPQRLAALQ
jgi:beta-lactamase class A